MSVKRDTWADIKVRTKPEIRSRIEAEARRLSDGLRSEAKLQNLTPRASAEGDLCERAATIEEEER